MTTKQNLIDLQKAIVDQYSEELKRLPLKKNTREDLLSGFKDGARSGIHHTIKMLGVEVTE